VCECGGGRELKSGGEGKREGGEREREREREEFFHLE
jgi:hypothetical protein